MRLSSGLMKASEKSSIKTKKLISTMPKCQVQLHQEESDKALERVEDLCSQDIAMDPSLEGLTHDELVVLFFPWRSCRSTGLHATPPPQHFHAIHCHSIF